MDENRKLNNDDFKNNDDNFNRDITDEIKIVDADSISEEEFHDVELEKIKRPFWHSIIPLRDDTRGEIIRKSAVLFFAVVFIVAAVYLGNYLFQSYKNKRQLEEERNMFYSGEEVLVDGLFNPRFSALIRQNGDIVGWLKVPGTDTDNPVVQNKVDPGFYLNHNFYKGESEYGTLFADKKSTFKSTGLSTNTLIFGHRMRDGSMLAGIKNYLDLKFYQENPVVEFTPIYTDGSNKWKVVSVFLSDTSDTEILAPTGPFNYLRNDFETETKFNAFVEEIYQRSVLKTATQDVQYGDKLLTLSTCSYEFDDARLVVVCRQVRFGETAEVDVSTASYNEKAVYPIAYYRSEGIDEYGSIVHTYRENMGSVDASANENYPNWASEISAIYRTPEMPTITSFATPSGAWHDNSFVIEESVPEESHEESYEESSEEVTSVEPPPPEPVSSETPADVVH